MLRVPKMSCEEKREEDERRRVSLMRRLEASISTRSWTMSTSTPSTILATVCVVDSSLALAIEWPKVYADYLNPVIQRLAELTSNVNQVAFACPFQSLATHPPPVQDRFHYIWSHVLSSFAPSLSTLLSAISSREQGDERGSRKAVPWLYWYWFQLRWHGCSRRHCGCTRGTCLQPPTIFSPKLNLRRCLISYANL